MYKITIDKIEKVERIEEGEYGVITTEPYSEDTINENGWNFDSWKDKERKIYGYFPPKKITKIITTEIYQQTVDDIDLPSVIIAINNIRFNGPDLD